MTQQSDQLPRIFQANMARLYQRVVEPTLERLPMHKKVMTGVTTSMDEFLDRAAKQVDNHTANEAYKVFVLTMAAIFERQLRLWAANILSAGDYPDIPGMKFDKLLAAVVEIAGIDMIERDLGTTLKEALLVANVVRHGEGPSMKALCDRKPELWVQNDDYVDLAPGPSPDSEMLRIRPDDLIRYVRAMIRFWGLADRLPMAVTEGGV